MIVEVVEPCNPRVFEVVEFRGVEILSIQMVGAFKPSSTHVKDNGFLCKVVRNLKN